MFFLLSQVIWGILRKCGSSVEKGTFKHLEVLTSRSNIPAVVKKNVSAAEDFMTVALDGHIIAAAVVFFKMDSTSSMSQQHSFPAKLQHATDAKKKAYFDPMNKKFMDTYVLNYASDSSSLLDGVTSNPGEDKVYNYMHACSFLTF